MGLFGKLRESLSALFSKTTPKPVDGRPTPRQLVKK